MQQQPNKRSKRNVPRRKPVSDNKQRPSRKRTRSGAIIPIPRAVLPRAQRPVLTTTPLPECTLKYLKILANPFGPVNGACVPTYPAKPSMKIRTYIHTNGSIGTGGVGFAMLAPCYDNTTPALHTTTPSFTSFAFSKTDPGVFGSSFTNSPFSIPDLTAQRVQARPVACGLRIVYTGTQLNLSGMTTCITEPDHKSILGKSIADLAAYGDNVTKSDPVARTWCYATAVPISPTDLEYGTTPYRRDGESFEPFMGIMITGVPGQSFRVEAYFHFEAIGVAATSPTDNEMDPNGAQAVIAAVSKARSDPTAKSPESWFQKALRFTRDYIAPAVTTIAPLLL